MSKMYFLTEAKKLELVKYQKAIDKKTLLKDHIAFSGSLKQHPYDVEKVIPSIYLVSELSRNKI